MITNEQLAGIDSSALVECDQNHRQYFLHSAVVDDWLALQQEARNAGFELAIASAYRSFSRQLKIWNDKANGLRPVLDAQGQPLDIATLTDSERVFAILRWSALPGGSRHHWGTDIDIYDSAAIDQSYQVQLTPAEVNVGGIFYPLHNWLDTRIAADSAFGFYRPYYAGAGPVGIAEERWHISHRPTSQRYLQCLSADVLYSLLQNRPDLCLRDAVLAHFDEIFSRYICS